MRKIVFNLHGDKFVSLNGDGCLFIHNFDLQADPEPIFTLSGQKISDFSIVDSEAMILLCQSSSNKLLQLVDVMTGDRICSIKNAGNLVCSDPQNRWMAIIQKKKLN